MTEEEAKELKEGDRVNLTSNYMADRVCQVSKVVERGIVLDYWPTPSAHGGFFEWHELERAKKL